MSENFSDVSSFIWSTADLLRDQYKRSKYADVILPFTVLRRLDCVMAPTKEDVLERYAQIEGKLDKPSDLLKRAAKLEFYNTSKYDFKKLLDDPKNIKQNMNSYLNGFSDEVQEIIEKFKLRNQIEYLAEKDLLYKVVQRFADVNMGPGSISNLQMGYIFEELIRKFNEQSNENPGEHFTPREIISLMVNLLMSKDKAELSKEGKIITVYDPACGSGGMLTVADNHIKEKINPKATVKLFGQEINDETYAVCKSDMMIKGEDSENIKYGSSFSKDGLKNSTFDYILSNPPYGKDWKQDKEAIETEYEMGSAGRFEVGLPRISDGQLLFLQHMVSKMHKPESVEVTRIAIVFNGSPLFTGDAGSGESEIRRWVIENDWLEAIIALPNMLFYNTGIFTYIWVLSNKKENSRKGKIALINAVDMYRNMRKGLGDKRHEISPEQIEEITQLYLGNIPNGRVKIFDGTDFGYRKINVERPLRMNFQASDERIERLNDEKTFLNLTKSRKRDESQKNKEINEGKLLQGKIINVLHNMDGTFYTDYSEFEKVLDNSFKRTDVKLTASLKKAIRSALGERNENAEPIKNNKGDLEADPDLKDYENVPLNENIEEYFEREVLPHIPDAWINEKYSDKRDGKIGKVGYEINFNKYFYEYEPPRALTEIDSDLKEAQEEILKLLGEVTK